MNKSKQKISRLTKQTKSAVLLVVFVLSLTLLAVNLQMMITLVSANPDIVTINTGHIPFGTVFPGESLEDSFSVAYTGDADIVEYKVIQRVMPLPGGGGNYLDLCPYLNKVSLDDGEGDTEGADGGASLDAFDDVDNWQILFEVPAIIGNVAQDHSGGFVSDSGEYGCEIYIEAVGYDCTDSWQIGLFDNSIAEFTPGDWGPSDSGPWTHDADTDTDADFPRSIAGPDEDAGGNLQTNEYNPLTIEFDLLGWHASNTYSLDLDIYDMQNASGFGNPDGVIAFDITVNGNTVYSFLADLPNTGNGVLDGSPSLEQAVPVNTSFLSSTNNQLVINVTDGDWIAVDALLLKECTETDGTVMMSSIDSGSVSGGLPIFSGSGSGGDMSAALESGGKPSLVINKRKVGSSVANPGDTNLEFEIIITNNGDQAAINVIVNDDLPPGFVFSGSDETSRTWELGDISPGEVSTIRYSADIDGTVLAGQYQNTIVVRSSNHESLSDSAPIEVEEVSVLGIESGELTESGFRVNELTLLVLLVIVILSAAFLVKNAYSKYW